jgi:hypothetical protein
VIEVLRWALTMLLLALLVLVVVTWIGCELDWRDERRQS